MRRRRIWCGRTGRAILAGVLLGSLASAPAASGQTDTAGTPATAPKPHPREKTLLKRRWGVEVMGVRLSAAGHMLEFRYKVLDADKAKPLFERKTKPLLVHEASGARLTVPVPAKTGPLRSSDPPVEGRIYWMFFTNPGRLVKPGEKVRVVIGKFRTEGLVVE